MTRNQPIDQTASKSFVGRGDELERFRDFLEAPDTFMLHVFGPPGIGKTEFLQHCEQLADARGWITRFLESQFLKRQPDRLREQIYASAEKIGTEDNGAIFWDTFELFQGSYQFIRRQLLRNLPEDVKVVTASREPLPTAWRHDSAWRGDWKSMQLESLESEAVRDYLTDKRVKQKYRDKIIDFAEGYPLAMVAGVDAAQQASVHRAPTRFERFAEGKLGALTEVMVDEVPSQAHRYVLWLSALVRMVEQSLIDNVLDAVPRLDDEEWESHELMEWLRKKPYFKVGARGVYPHAEMRRLLENNLDWRNPEGRRQLVEATSKHYRRQVRHNSRPFSEIAEDNYYLFRHIIGGDTSDSIHLPGFWDSPTEPEIEWLASKVREYEGEGSEYLFWQWAERQPENLRVLRGEEGTIRYLSFHLELEESAVPDFDPVVNALTSRLENVDWTRIHMSRFWMFPEHYQSLHEVELGYLVRASLEGARARFHNLDHDVFADLDSAQFIENSTSDRGRAFYEMEQVSVGDNKFVLSSVNWAQQSRVDMALMFLKTYYRKWLEKTGATHLSRDAFGRALKSALQNFDQPCQLRNNPLLYSALVETRVDDNKSPLDRVDILKEKIRDGVKQLGSEGERAEQKYALERTYLDPADKQSLVADELNVSYSTYHRRLKKAIKRFETRLWESNQAARDAS